jgi:DNA-binding NtrC family response regulator
MEQERLLIIENDEEIQTQLKSALHEEYAVSVAGHRAQALTAIQQEFPGIVTLDLELPPNPNNGEEGLRLLEDILRVAPATKVVVITGNGDQEKVVKGMGRAVFDCHSKPVDLEELKVVLRRAAYIRRIENDISATVNALPTLREARDLSDRRIVVNALALSRGNITRAARTLDISRPTFHHILAKHGIDAKVFK